MSKCRIVGNLMRWLIFVYYSDVVQGNMRPISMEDIQYGVNKIKESKQTMKDSISMIQLD